MKHIYFDSASNTILLPEVINEMLKCMNGNITNASSTHYHGRNAKVIIEDVRKKISTTLHTTTSEIYFTSGGTEGNNFILKSAIKSLNLKTIISSKLEHHAVLHTIENISLTNKIPIKWVKIDEKGNIDYENLEKLLNENENCLVSLMFVNNEIGNISDIEKIGEICSKYNAFYHCDAVQGVGKINIDLSKTKISALTASAHKFHGPTGTGFVYLNNKYNIEPLIFGGGQERNMRAGTENVYAIAGMGKAYEIANNSIIENYNYINDLKSYFIQNLKDYFPKVRINGNYKANLKNSIPYIVSVSFPWYEDADMLLINLDLEGFSCSGGSACSSGASTGSHVLNELYPHENKKYKTVRFSFSKLNNYDEIDDLLSALKSNITF